jgi:hypothetical protein
MRVVPVPMKQDFSHYRGDTLDIAFKVWQDVAHTIPADFSSAVVTAQVRSTTETADIAGEFDVSTSGNTIRLTLDPKQTRELSGPYVFDVEVDWDGTDTDVQTVVAGALAIAQDVSRVLTP